MNSGSQNLLREELQALIDRRKQDAPRFKQKILAEELGMLPSVLSEFLNGKRVLKRKAALKYFKPHLSNERWEEIDQRFQSEKKSKSKFSISQDRVREDLVELENNPLYAAILVCLELKDCDHSAAWIGKKLGNPVEQIRERLDRLLRLRFLQQDAAGAYFRVNTRTHSLQHAKEAVNLNEDLRRFMDFTVGMDPIDLSKFVQKLHELIRKFSFTQRKSSNAKVFKIVYAVFPVSH